MNRFWKLITILGLGMAAWLAICFSQVRAAQSIVPDRHPGAVLQLIPRWTYDDRTQVGAAVGSAVSGAGDVNGDGYADVLVGAEKYTLTVDAEGAALAFYGSASGLGSEPNWSAGGGLKGSRFGCAVAAAGDVDGDGFDDVLVGANRYNVDQPEEGAAFLYFGSASGLEDTPGWQVKSNQKAAQMGSALSGAGDINADGYADVIIGAMQYEHTITNTNEGAAFVFYGGEPGLASIPDWIAAGGKSGAQFGASVAGAGDVNGDGWDDVIVGAPQYKVMISTTVENVGAAFVFYGSADGLGSSPNWTMLGSMIDGEFGAAVAGAGDVNQDGYADVLVGEPYGGTTGAAEVGAVYLYLGSEDGLQAAPAWQATSDQIYSLFGQALGAAGDVDEDGLPDIWVGAPQYSEDQPSEGAVFIYSGRSSGLSAVPSAKVFGEKAEAAFGSSGGNAGDVYQNGLPELIVGAPLYKLDTVVVGRSILFSSQVIDSWYIYLPVIINP